MTRNIIVTVLRPTRIHVCNPSYFGHKKKNACVRIILLILVITQTYAAKSHFTQLCDRFSQTNHFILMAFIQALCKLRLRCVSSDFLMEYPSLKVIFTRTRNRMKKYNNAYGRRWSRVRYMVLLQFQEVQNTYI